MPERRRATPLTPLESELRSTEDRAARVAPSLVTHFRRRLRQRRRPTTLFGAIAQGLARLAVAVAVASGVALLLDDLLHRSAALGFYIVGAALLAVAFSTSVGMSGRMAGWYSFYDPVGRQRRLNLGVAYIVAGVVVIGVAVAIEALTWSKVSRGGARSSGFPLGLEQRSVRSSDGGSD